MDDIVAKLTRELGPDAVVTGDEVRTRSTGWMRPGPNLAKALVRPRTTEEVSKTLRHVLGSAPTGGAAGRTHRPGRRRDARRSARSASRSSA